MNTVASPAKWMGGKAAAAGRIIEAFPDPASYDIYVEPCGGAAHVLMAKPPYRHREIYSDLDDLLVNFWIQVQQDPQGVQTRLQSLPYARKLYYDFYHSLYGSKTRGMSPDESLSNIEKAVRWLYILRSNMTAYMRQSPPSWTYMNARTMQNVAETIHMVQERFRYVAIDNRDAIQTIKRYDKLKDRVFFYVDPPYFGVEHYYPASRDGFDHEGLAEVLNSCKSQVALSYYPHPEIDRLYPLNKWRRITWTQCKPSNVSENSEEIDIATEMLLCNYGIQRATQTSLWIQESEVRL